MSQNNKYEFSIKPGQEWVPCWVPCPECDDYFCEQHNEHAADCDCPSIEEWVDRDVWPYKDEDDEPNRD